MKALKAVIFGFGAIAGAYGLAYLLRQGKLLKQTTINVESVKNHSISLAQSTADVTIKINNNSDLTFNITDQKYKLLISGAEVGSAYSNDKILLRPHASANTTLHIKIDTKRAIKATGQMSFGSLPITINGKLSGSTGKLMLSRLPFEVKFNLNEL